MSARCVTEEEEMSYAKGKPIAIVCAAALAIAVPLSEVSVRAVAGPGPLDRWNVFSADVTIRRGLRDATLPSTKGDGPALRYRWERVQAAGRWKSTIAVLGGTRPDVVTPTGQSLTIPPAIARIEDDGDGSEPRFYDLQGVLIRVPLKSDRLKMGASESVFAATDALTESRPGAAGSNGNGALAEGREWIESLLPSLQQKSVRRAALQNRFGKSSGIVHGLGRYLQTIGDETTEVLADDDWAVPVEINVVRQGVLKSHATFEYEPGPGGSLLRRKSHVEHAIPDRSGTNDARLVFDVELTNVKLEDRR
jgi:hypothetical protein